MNDEKSLAHGEAEGAAMPTDAARNQTLRAVGDVCNAAHPRALLAAPRAVPDWRELARRLYVELHTCDQQMRSTLNEEGEPHWTQSSVVRDVLADAKRALDDAPAAPVAEPACEHIATWADGKCADCGAKVVSDDELAQRALADRDIEMYGRAFFVDGRRVEPERVSIVSMTFGGATQAVAADGAATDEYSEGYRAALNSVACDVRNLYVNHVFHTGTEGLSNRCKQLEQKLLTKAGALLEIHRERAAVSPAPVAPAEAREPSPTAGMTLAERIKHVGGRENAATYIEFGSVAAVDALIKQVIRDLPWAAHADAGEAVQPTADLIARCRELQELSENGQAEQTALRSLAGTYRNDISAHDRRAMAMSQTHREALQYVLVAARAQGAQGGKGGEA